jgi:Na+/H+ antiporter NhaC
MILSGEGSGLACFGVPIMLLFGIALLYQGITGKGIKAKKGPALSQSQSEAVEPSSRLKASESVDKKTPWVLIIIVTVVVLVIACVGCSIVAVLLNFGGV